MATVPWQDLAIQSHPLVKIKRYYLVALLVIQVNLYKNIKESMLLRVIPLFATIIINDGKNSNLKEIHHLIEQHMHPFVSIIISMFLVVR